MIRLSLPPHPAHRVIFFGALYDALVTLPLATPWSANLLLGQLAALHARLGLSGEVLPGAAGISMLFINLMGTVVLLWSLVRLLQPSAFNGAVDSLGRICFAGWMAYALHGGATPLLGVFLAGEVLWLLMQAGAVRVLWRQYGRLLPA